MLITMVFTMALAAVAASAIYIGANATLITKSYDKEDELRYAAEAALAMGKARLNYDPGALPDSAYDTFLSHQTMSAADGQVVPGVFVSLYAGPTGSTTGQFGRFASVVAEARDAQGTGFVRRLELAQESFAKFAYWSNHETSGGGTIYFANGDQLWGPVWSNDNISLSTGGATFHDDVGTAGVINSVALGTYIKGYRTNQKPIALPSTTALDKLAGYAAAGGFNLTPPTSGSEASVKMRIEFVALDMNNDGDSTDTDEGFFKVYSVGASGSSSWLRADWPSGSPPTANSMTSCGDWHAVTIGGPDKFFPVSVHSAAWFAPLVQAGGMSASAAATESAASVSTIMQHANARCFLGGDPHLVAVERTILSHPTAGDRQKGGDDTTFTATDPNGAWQAFTTTPNGAVAARRPYDAQYLFPIYRGINSGSKGVIYANGTVGVSGVLRGRITVYSPNTIVVLDDLRYTRDPAAGVCQDILGIIAGANIVVADNAVNTPQQVTWSGTTVVRNLDDTKDLYLHSVLMALGTSFRAQNHASGPNNVNDCEGSNNGRGCLYLTGGLIQDSRGPVGTTGGTGFVKRYSYDRCAVMSPPPYFPTTGRFTDNRYLELDPVGFDVAALFKSLTPEP